MARETVSRLVNLDDVAEKRRLIAEIGALSGFYEAELSPRRNTRSLQQNRWYFACIVPSLAAFLADQDYENCSEAFAHALLKQKCLSRDFIDRETGEVIATPAGSTAKLDTEQFSRYCERCRHWLEEKFGIVVPDPEVDPRKREPRRRVQRKAMVPA